MSKVDFDEEIFRYFKKYICDSSDLDHIVGWEVFAPMQILVTLDNGDKLLYDHMQGGVRHLTLSYLEKPELSEEEWRHEFMYRLRDALNSRTINHRTLAERTGISETMLSRYANGKATPSFYVISKIAKAIRYPIEELLRFPGRS